MQEKPLIFITNDDGIHAKGLRALIAMARELGEVVVVAPDRPRSGMSHAVTVSNPLRIRLIKEEPFYREYACNGTPADSVKLGEKVVMQRRPDLLLSGINHGSNAGINLFYSGTMAAAIEGAMSGVPSIGFSLLDYDPDADFEAAMPHLKHIVRGVLERGLQAYTCLNVNVPAIARDDIQGIKICRMGKGLWEELLEERRDPHDYPYYWLAGHFVSLDANDDTDEWALANRYISLVPIQLDLTAYTMIEALKILENHVQIPT